MNDTQHGFEFRGRAGEWFGIWIVNLLLSICTIGIYSAWAKVRRNKYFYNNTFVNGRSFDYHATGKQILIGRVIVAVGYVIFSVASSLNPFLAVILAIGLFIALPWFLVRSIKFNARMTSFSNVRFDFHGGAGRAFVIYLLFPFLAYLIVAFLGGLGVYLVTELGLIIPGAAMIGLGVIVLVLALPFVDRAVKQFTISNHSLGVSKLDMQAGLTPFIKALVVSILWVVGVLVIGAVFTGISLSSYFLILERVETDPTIALRLMGLLYFFFFAALLPAGAIYQAMTRNAVYNATVLQGGHSFRSNVQPLRLFWIIMSNAITVICTLGLMLPWAQIRMAKYLADHTAAVPNGSMDDFVGMVMPEGSALGDAYTDFEAIDIGLPI
ncbi:MAG: YjgN family protein [Litoreibacter sp.]